MEASSVSLIEDEDNSSASQEKDSSLDPTTFYFESDHLALKGKTICYLSLIIYIYIYIVDYDCD